MSGRIPGIDAEFLPLNLGGNTFGWTTDEAASFEVLDAFTEAGGSFVDTADMYSQWAPGNSGGESEQIIGAWTAARGNRDRVLIATKVGALDGFRGLGRDTVHRSVENSLRRLRTDRVDLLYAHHDDPETSIEEQARVFDEVVRAGKARAVAVSNHSPERVREWFETARRLGLAEPAAIQPHYNLVHRRGYETGLLPVVREFGPAVLPYYGLASGFLTGKYRTQQDLTGGARDGAAGGYLNEDGLAVVAALDEVAAAHAARPATVALAWLLAKGVTAPVASVSRPDQLPALLAAGDLRLSQDEVAALDAASAVFA